MITRRSFLSYPAVPLISRAGAEAAPGSILDQVRAGKRVKGADIVDAHAHFKKSLAGLIWPRNVEMLLADAERCGIGQVIASHVAAYMAVSGDQIKAAHDECAEAAARYGRRLRVYLVFHPRHLETSVAEMQRALAPGSPFVGFKLHGAIARYPSDGPAYRPVFEFANEHGLPVLLHPWRGLEGISSIMKRYRRMTLTLAHMGLLPDELGDLLKAQPNLFVDTCGSTLPYRHLERLVRQAGAEKIMFGTDATYLAIGPQLAKIGFAHISEGEKRLILGGNARRLFGSRLTLA